MTRITGQAKGGSFRTKATDLNIQGAVGRNKINRLLMEKEIMQRMEQNHMMMAEAGRTAGNKAVESIPIIGGIAKAWNSLGRGSEQRQIDKMYPHEKIKLSDADTHFYADQTAEFNKISSIIDYEDNLISYFGKYRTEVLVKNKIMEHVE